MKLSILTALLLCGPAVCLAQSTAAPKPAAYDFLTVIDSEGQFNNLAKIIFAPAYNGKSDIQLKSLPGTISDKYFTVERQNLELVNQQLTELTAAGWELVHVSSREFKTYYLLRKAKN